MISFKFPDGNAFKIQGLSELKDTAPLMGRIAELLKAYVDENFEQEGRPKAWQPLSKLYGEQKAQERPGSKILHASGMLKRSIQIASSDNFAKVSTNKVYARIHHFGGIIRSRKGKALKIGITIPARPFMTITREDTEEIYTEIQNFVKKKLGL